MVLLYHRRLFFSIVHFYWFSSLCDPFSLFSHLIFGRIWLFHLEPEEHFGFAAVGHGVVGYEGQIHGFAGVFLFPIEDGCVLEDAEGSSGHDGGELRLRHGHQYKGDPISDAGGGSPLRRHLPLYHGSIADR